MDTLSFVLLLVLFAQMRGAAWLARRSGRSVVGWVLLILVLHVIGLLVLAGLPRLRLTCPRCANPYDSGAVLCESCGAALPAAGVADRLTPGERYDQQCPNCETPYRDEDYQDDAEHIYCSGCRGELPRRAGSLTESIVRSNG